MATASSCRRSASARPPLCIGRAAKTPSRAAALTLIRCARLYQDALWMAESQPALAWLLLVSALETGAVYWRSGKEDVIVRVRTENTELYDDLAKLDSTMPRRVAEAFKDSFGVTKKFVDFVL